MGAALETLADQLKAGEAGLVQPLDRLSGATHRLLAQLDALERDRRLSETALAGEIQAPGQQVAPLQAEFAPLRQALQEQARPQIAAVS